MGIIFDDEVPTFVKIIIWMPFFLIGFSMGMNYGEVDTQLANAICEEHYGTQLNYIDIDGWDYNVDKVVCEKPIKKQEMYDGLIVKIE